MPYWASDNYGKEPEEFEKKKDMWISILTLISILFFLLIVTLGLAMGHGAPVVEDDPCIIVFQESTDHGTVIQWCDLTGDGEAELFQEIIFSDGKWYYLDMGGL